MAHFSSHKNCYSLMIDILAEKDLFRTETSTCRRNSFCLAVGGLVQISYTKEKMALISVYKVDSHAMCTSY